jgi:ribonuclease-3
VAVTKLKKLLDGLDPQLADLVFTHSSWVAQRHDSYERLAFLGDSVLGLAISSHLFPRFEEATAGRLTKIRAQAVSGRACARVAKALGVPQRLTAHQPDDAENTAHELMRGTRVLASVCEAVIGACYMQYGFRRTSAAVVEAFANEIEIALNEPDDFKSQLQELLAMTGEHPHYEQLSEAGPAHDRTFEYAVEIRGERYGRGRGSSKKEAQRAAAERALQRLNEENTAE